MQGKKKKGIKKREIKDKRLRMMPCCAEGESRCCGVLHGYVKKKAAVLNNGPFKWLITEG